MVARPWSSSRLSCGERLFLRCNGSLEFFPNHAGEGSLLSIQEGETGLPWMWSRLSCFLSSGDGYVGELVEVK